jgi:hypothetical protein
MRREVSAVTRTYGFVLWLLPHIAGFARQHRFTLGDRLEGGVLEVLELLIEASYTWDKRALLQRANLRLERVRYLIRLAVDLKLLTVKQYEFAARAIVTIGGEIGGWTRSDGEEWQPAQPCTESLQRFQRSLAFGEGGNRERRCTRSDGEEWPPPHGYRRRLHR